MAGYSLLFITLDTTRADRIGCYGNEAIQTPFIDGLAKNGVLFSRAIAVGPTTLPSHSSMMTGLFPHHHEARANGFTRLPNDKTTLAEVLGAKGYQTGGFVSAFVLDARFGIGQGFNEYDDKVEEKLDRVATLRDPERRANHTTDRAIAWLEHKSDQPFFAWVHYFDPHQPYTPPQEFADAYPFYYDGEIAFVDTQIGRLLQALKDLKVADKTIVVVMGDHGQGFLQHFELTHGLFVYDSTLHVPFVMSWGGWKGGGLHIPREVSGVDVMPTVLSLLGVAAPAGVDGVDLTKSPAGADRAILGETLEGLDQYAVAPLLTLRQGGMKYIYAPEPELYDVLADPDEEHNLVDEQPEVAAKLRKLLEQNHGGDLAKAAYIKNTEQLSPDEIRQLQALGYAGSSLGGALVPGEGSLPDPKSVVRLIKRCEQAWEISQAEGVEAAVRHLEEIVDEAPDFYAGYRLLATFLLDAKDHERSLKALERCLEIHPDIPFPLVHIARAHFKSGRVEQAIEYYDKAIKASPDLVAAHLELGRILLSRNQPAIAVDHLLKAFVLSPTDQSCVEAMAMAMARSNRLEEAVSHLRTRLQQNPDLLAVRNALCGLLLEQKKCEEVIVLMREGLKRHPGQNDLTHNLAYAIIMCKLPDAPMIEAAVMMEKLCEETGYQTPEYLRTLAMVYAELFRVDEAIGVAEKGLALAQEKERPVLVANLKDLLAIYREMKRRGISPMSGNKPGLTGTAPPTSQPSASPQP